MSPDGSPGRARKAIENAAGRTRRRVPGAQTRRRKAGLQAVVRQGGRLHGAFAASAAEAAAGQPATARELSRRARKDSNRWPAASKAIPATYPARPLAARSLPVRPVGAPCEAPGYPGSPSESLPVWCALGAQGGGLAEGADGKSCSASKGTWDETDKRIESPTTFLRPREVADRLAVCTATIYRLIALVGGRNAPAAYVLFVSRLSGTRRWRRARTAGCRR